jgi:cytochrome c553
MKTGGLKLVVQAAALAIFMPAAAHAGDVNAKLELCQSCHNLSFQGYSGYVVVPRLAGQTPEYITNQLKAFAERKRERGMFFNIARTHKVPAGMQDALARRFQSMHGKPLGGGSKHLVETGRKIYLDGVPGEDVPACASCHGQEAEGKDVSARLAGQSYRYLVRELTRWKEARGQGTEQGAPKKKAHTLSPSEIEAVSAYVSYLP